MDNHHILIAKALEQSGKKLKNLSETEFKSIAEKANRENPWFTPDNVKFCFDHWASVLEYHNIVSWLSRYNTDIKQTKNVGIVAAGNIPMVSLHDIICVLASGHNLHLKPSSEDKVLIQFFLDLLIEHYPQLKNRIQFIERFNHVEAMIATGSNNSSRYFEYYFSKIPNIIRKNRSSVAVLNSKPSPEEISKLGIDIFTYFGLGCRNVTKLYVPHDFDFVYFFDNLQSFKYLMEHNKYANNHDYHNSIYLLSKIKIWDNDIVILKEDNEIHTPVSVINYEYYSNINELNGLLSKNIDNIQCIVSNVPLETNHLQLGEAQTPTIDSYADNVDTMQFLIELN